MAKRLPQFLNVDLEIRSRSSLDPLIAALGRKTVVLASFRHRGVHGVTLELLRSPKSAASAMRSFARLIRQLPAPAQNAWQRAQRRDFDAGFELVTSSQVVVVAVPHEVAQQISEVGGRIVFTFYPPSTASRAGTRPSRAAIVRLA